MLKTSHAFSEGDWALVRTIADGLEWSYGWSAAAAQWLRFLLDFGYATGQRASEFVGATLGHVETDPRGDYWLRVTGKGKKLARVALPPLAWDALARYLADRGLPPTQLHWRPETPVVGNLETDSSSAISSVRRWMVMLRFFHQGDRGGSRAARRKAASGESALDAAHARHPRARPWC
ncbi:integrase [Paraburkholderia bannensis]|uniref:Integrase n=1 Tax=Paraburkholderia bannensis TaxID=765414 RepID=A0A7W9U426_9BURK|nr:integrase [Paraburkholderia sp. WP4_3_2]MBB6106636.1 integrase [Paraburkholderia bannensis]